MDAAEKVGGADGATRPMEMNLIGLGGCTPMDVISMLLKKRVPFDDLEVTMEAERSDTYQTVCTKIRMHYIFHGIGINAK